MIDIFGGLLIFFNFVSFLHIFLLYLGITILFKGIMSVLYGLEKRFYLDFLGGIDILSGLLLIFTFFGLPAGFVWIFGVLLLSKGIWSFLFAL
ncbi:MAG: hypothetical protein HYT70_04405 [Candidatus Aenigmarchaeota archaeon]|nr:hypothetical protein [Candidatus Aenigmarchaeota archaeon]